MNSTVKLTIEGPPDLVEAVSSRIDQFFTVTYTSKDRNRLRSSYIRPNDSISRYKLVLPPAQAHVHTLPMTPGPGQETTDSDSPPSGESSDTPPSGGLGGSLGGSP